MELPVWIDDWVHQCCGDNRRVGETVDIDLTFEGDMLPAAGVDQITVLDGGRVSVVGRVIGSATEGHTSGVLVESGALRFGVSGNSAADRVQCTGRLVELRHGFPSWATAGQVTGIQWCPGIEVDRGGRTEVVGYGHGDGQELESTEDWMSAAADEGSWAFNLTLRITDDVAR
jgi:hypothetical protein